MSSDKSISIKQYSGNIASVHLFLLSISILCLTAAYNIVLNRSTGTWGSWGPLDRLVMMIFFCLMLISLFPRHWIFNLEQSDAKGSDINPARQIPSVTLIPAQIAGICRKIFGQHYERICSPANLLGCLVILGFVLRSINPGILQPHEDEYLHLLAARDILEYGISDYTRAYILSYTVSVFFSIFGTDVVTGRLPGIIISSLTVVPLYLLIRNASKPAAIIAALLWTFSPWAILVGRNIREYAIFPFFMLFYLLMLFYCSKGIFQVISRKKRPQWKDLVYLIAVILPICYALFLDPNSSFKQVLLFIPSVTLYFVYRYFTDEDIHKGWKSYGALATIAAVTASLVIYFNNYLIALKPHPDTSWVYLFLKELSYYDSGLLYTMFIMLFLLGITGILIKKEELTMCILFTFIAGLYFMAVHFDVYFRPKYAFFLFPLLLAILSMGIVYIYKTLSRLNISPDKKTFSFAIVTLILIALFNPFLIHTALTYDRSEETYWTMNSPLPYTEGEAPWTMEHHYIASPLANEFKDAIGPEDTVIASLPNAMAWHFETIDRNKLYRYNYSNPEVINQTEKKVTNNKQGWILLDLDRNGRWNWSYGLPQENITMKNTQIIYTGKYGDFYVYRWKEIHV